MKDYNSQDVFEIRLEWGTNGFDALGEAEAVVIVDVLSFSTCVDIVVAQGGQIYPYAFKDETAVAFARRAGFELAAFKRNKEVPSLAASSLINVGAIKLVLPSPNGSAISILAEQKPCYASCLRNAAAVALELRRYSSVAVIAAGERWSDGSIRFALEDLIGAGALIAELDQSKSPEALLAQLAFESALPGLKDKLMECGSGRELVERGFPEDVVLASELNCSRAVPRLMDGCYREGTAKPKGA